MSYTITALQSMSDDEIKSIAEGMGLKKINPANREDNIYKILDQQAIMLAANAPEEAPRKPKAQAQTQAQPAKEGDNAEEPGAVVKENAPRKRGRKPGSRNAKNAGENAVTPDAAASAAEELIANPDAVELSANESAPVAENQPKKRGRKPKQKGGDAAVSEELSAGEVSPEVNDSMATEFVGEDNKDGQENKPEPVSDASRLIEASATAENSGDNHEQVAPGPRVFTPRNAPQVEGQANVNQQRGPKVFGRKVDESFGAFFPHAAGKSFTPRSQRERQEAAVMAQSAPIVIREPQPDKMPQEPKGKKNKKKGQQMQKPQALAIPAYDFSDFLKAEGVLEITPEGYGFLRSSDFNYLASPDDIYVTAAQIKSYALKAGDVVECTVNPPREGEKYFPMERAITINGRQPEFIRDRVPFEHLTPLFPDEKFNLCGGRTCNLSTRVVDMFAPIGKGQRALIVAPPKTGKTILLKDIANAIAENHPEVYIMILLIDERPEEVTDMSRSVNAEVIASTFDEPADRHVKIAGIVLEKAKRMVECGHDVVILLDSITRLARAYNTAQPASGKILSGGVDANALQKPKRFFGAARNIEGGGSLTIIATALTETSSKMDEVIFEEFKGTGNMELQLDRKLSNKSRITPFDIMASSTRRDDLLLREETLNRMWILRRFLSDRNSIEAMEFIKDRMERSADNDELLRTMGD